MNEIDRIFQIAGEHAEHELYPISVGRVAVARPTVGLMAGPSASK